MAIPAPEVLKGYFASIESSFRETVADKRKVNWLELIGITSVFGTLFSIIGLIPGALSDWMPKLLNLNTLTIRGLKIPLGAWWIWWPITTAVFLGTLVLVMRLEVARDKRNAKRWISEAQM